MFFIDAAKFAFFGYDSDGFSAYSSVYFRASCAWILSLSLFKDFFAKTLNDVRLDMGGKSSTIYSIYY